MTDLSKERFILTGSESFLPSLLAFQSKLHLLDDEVTPKSRIVARLNASISCGPPFLFVICFYFIIDITDDPSLSRASKCATIAWKITPLGSFAFFFSSLQTMQNLMGSEKFASLESV